MREIEFRGKRKDNGEWVYGDLLQPTPLCDIYEISDNTSVDGSRYEVIKETIGQFIGEGEYGRIYEGMKLNDEYEEEYCTVEYDEEECRFGLVYDGYETRIYTLDGLRIVEED